jgi:nitrogen-specific signal transduction histidine kinase
MAYKNEKTNESVPSEPPTDSPSVMADCSEKTTEDLNPSEQHRDAFLDRVIESLPHPFYVINVRDYTIVLANSASGIVLSDRTTRCFEATHNRISPCDGADHPCPLCEVTKTKRPVTVEHTHYNQEGEERYLEVHASPVIDDSGDVIQVIEYDLDMTEQRWTENRLENETKRSRLYLDLLAHDMANQLQILTCDVELLDRKLLLYADKDLEHIAEDIRNALVRSNAMISKARGSEQLRWVPLVTRSLPRAIMDASNELSELYDGFILHLNFEISEANVLADLFLDQLFLNLMENAVIHNTRRQKEVWITLVQSDGAYEVSVSDNGPGIAPDIAMNLFDPGMRVGGLGLQLSKEIVDKYGGRIQVHSRIPGKYQEGSEFVVILPRIGCVSNEQGQ